MSPRSSALRALQTRYTIAYLAGDVLAAALAYTWLYSYRKGVVEPARFGLESMHWDDFYPVGTALVAGLWATTLATVGLYQSLLRKSRLTELSRLLQTWFFFVLAFFLLFVLDDYVKSYTAYWGLLSRFGGTLLAASALSRLAVGAHIRWQISSGRLHFPTLLLGDRSLLEAHLPEIRQHAASSGEVLAGWMSLHGTEGETLCCGLPLLGPPSEIANWAKRLNVEDVILALPPEEHHRLTPLLLDLEELGLRIFMFPDTYGILSGMVGMDEHGVPLMEWHHEPMDAWQRNSKRLADVVLSALALVVLAPVMAGVAAAVAGTRGPVFFRQERLGRYGTPFRIVKFRTMRSDAEAAGPQLSSEEDPRITSVGRVLRKYRLDELPQFWNVLVGDMSIVGPRPERAFFAQQIIDRAPQYRHIYKVRPGITSWGMVRYGYASDVDQMIRRMEFDLLYIENMSWRNDLKVLLYTVWTVLKGRGK
ncbi:MAG: hypothetical protein RL738_311 [Bacteroidota bacterium]